MYMAVCALIIQSVGLRMKLSLKVDGHSA